MTTSIAEPTELDVGLIDPDPDQPRKTFTGLGELAATMKPAGVLQPLVVRPHPKEAGRWMIVLGERRWRAAQLAGLKTVPAFVRRGIEDRVFFFQIIENLADYRHPLEALERATALDRYVKEVGMDVACTEFGKEKDWFSRERALVKVSSDIWQQAEAANIHDKRTILDLHRLCEHTGRTVETEWENIKAMGVPVRDALAARMEASGAKKKRKKKDEESADQVAAPTAASTAASGDSTAGTAEPAPAGDTVRIAPAPPPRAYRRTSIPKWIKAAEQHLGVSHDKDFEAFFEAVLIRAVQATANEAGGAARESEEAAQAA